MKAAAIDAALKGRFQGLAARPAPEHILRVVDMLEAASPPGHGEGQITEGDQAGEVSTAR